MIYDFEACVLKHINKVCPEVKLATYAKEKDMFGSLAKLMQVPALLYYREATDWNFGASFRLNENGNSTRFVPCEQSYIARIYLATTSDSIFLANKVRFFLEDNPYVTIPFNKDKIDVALRLLYIKVDEDRTITDQKGPLKYIEFSWRSVLFLSDYQSQKWGLVQQVRIYLNEGEAQIFNDKTLIKVIK